MVKFIGYIVCLISAGWLVLEDLHFRQSIRDDVNVAHARMFEFDPNSPGSHGKILNGYYEDVYSHLPKMILPALLVVVGATLLVVSKQKPKTEPPPAGDVANRAAPEE